MGRFHHVNLGVPVGGVAAQTLFLVDLLRYQTLEAPQALRGRAHWFEGEDGTQIHLSEDPDHRPAAQAHVAVDFGEELAALEGRLELAGYECEAFDGPAGRIVLCRDPAGNRWELRGPRAM